jgi:hypothetical protein
MAPNDLTDPLKTFQAMADKLHAEEKTLAEEEREKKHSEQAQNGSCTIVPFPRKVRTEPFRSELTIEQSSLFVANGYQKKHFTREWAIKTPFGELVTRRLTVGKNNVDDEPRGVLKQVHQDVFYRLLRLWGELGYKLGTMEGKTYGSVTTSAYHLVTALRGDDSAGEYRRVQNLLQDITSIPIVLETEQPNSKERNRKQFTLLSDVRWDESKLDIRTHRPKPGGKSEVTILFSSMVTEGFLDKHYKTLLGAPYRSLGNKGELARLLYPYLDAQLATKDHFHIKLQALAERFGLTQHSKLSYRKRQFENAVKSLNGKMIKSEEYVLRVSLRESTEDEDYILVAKRELNTQLRLFKDED